MQKIKTGHKVLSLLFHRTLEGNGRERMKKSSLIPAIAVPALGILTGLFFIPAFVGYP